MRPTAPPEPGARSRAIARLPTLAGATIRVRVGNSAGNDDEDLLGLIALVQLCYCDRDPLAHDQRVRVRLQVRHAAPLLVPWSRDAER